MEAKAYTERMKNSLILLQNTPVQMTAFEHLLTTRLATNILKLTLSLNTKEVDEEPVDNPLDIITLPTVYNLLQVESSA